MLALEMVSKAAKKIHGINIAVKSVFSCEIEEYKQAYIERNFAPPILFRDAEQLQFDIATTAYGSETAVPGGVDILIAGTSCKDASSLNNHKQDLRFGSGESTRTYRGMLGWVTKHLPAFVVLENVCGAPSKQGSGKDRYAAPPKRLREVVREHWRAYATIGVVSHCLMAIRTARKAVIPLIGRSVVSPARSYPI